MILNKKKIDLLKYLQQTVDNHEYNLSKPKGLQNSVPGAFDIFIPYI